MCERTLALTQEGSRRLCESCGDQPWKYRCPGCDRLSCSLPCVKQHKLELGCDGKRNKAAFVSLSHFDDNRILSDYYFLEDVSRFVDSMHRGHVCHDREQGSRSKLQWVCTEAGRRGTIVLLQPLGMSLHSINTSTTVWKGHRRRWTILWRVHLVFPQSEAEYQEDSVPENTVLRDLLNKYIHPTEGEPVARHRLQRYVRGGGVEAVDVFLVDGPQLKEPRYCQLEVGSTLRDNLRHKKVVEFPILHVVMREESNVYTHKVAKCGNQVNTSTQPSERCEEEGRRQQEVVKDGEQGRLGRRGGEELSEGELDSDSDTAPPLARATNSLQMIADMYTDDDDDEQ